MKKTTFKKPLTNPTYKNISYASCVCFTLINLTLLVATSYLWFVGRKQLQDTSMARETVKSSEPQTVISLPTLFQPLVTSEPASALAETDGYFNKLATVDTSATAATTAPIYPVVDSPPGQPPRSVVSEACNDPIWCSVPIPKKSHYKFDTPIIDKERWKRAQLAASRGEQVLLRRIIRQFPNTFDFLDGDRSFRRLHSLMDIFVDHKSGLTALLQPAKSAAQQSATTANQKKRAGVYRRLAAEEAKGGDDGEDESSATLPKASGADTNIAGHVDGKRVVPDAYNFRTARRAPIVQMGYFGFKKNLNTFFSGDFIGGNFIKKQDFFFEWSRVKNQIDVPFITVCALNENWGLLSTMFPNRTAAWGQCCEPQKEKLLYEFLNHDKTLMLITNQHHNMSHPKLLTIPRGIPLTWQFTAKLMWDSQRFALHNVKKTKLLFAASSNWGARGQMIRCISKKFLVNDFEGHADAPTIQKKNSLIKLDRRHYYEKLGGTLFGLALPGLGYDCFRTWELLTMGTIVILERGVGLDRTVRSLAPSSTCLSCSFAAI